MHSRVVAESDRVPEHERAAADPASVETCPYFDEGGEDVTLPCRILDLVGEGGGWCLYFLAWRAEILSSATAPPLPSPPPPQQAVTGLRGDDTAGSDKKVTRAHPL